MLCDGWSLRWVSHNKKTYLKDLYCHRKVVPNTMDGSIFRPVLNVIENLKFCHHIIIKIILEIVYQTICEIKLYVLFSHLVQHLG